MRRWASLWLGILSVALAGCSTAEKHHASALLPTPAATPSPKFTFPSTTLPIAVMPTSFPTLETITDPYPNEVALLDGVCFEYLYSLSGQTWLWATPEDINSFYDQVDASKRCPYAVERRSFDFNRYALAGAVSTGTGCDAAHCAVNLVQDDSAHAQTLFLELNVLPGCPYELVQPFLVAVPHPPEGYRFNIVITSP